MTRIKAGVDIGELRAVMVVGLMVAQEAFGAVGKELVVTSGDDSKHSKNSLHYQNKALDLRTRHLAPGEGESIVAQMQDNLGNDWDIILEDDHIHMEYDPSPPGWSTT